MLTAITAWIQKDDRGASMVEYALIIALIAMIAFVAVNLIGPSVSHAFSSTASGFSAGN